MQWFDRARTRLRLLFARRSAESRMEDEFRFHIEMEADHRMRSGGLAADEARRQALAAFGGVQKHKEELRDGRGLAWLGGLSLDVKLGIRMLLKYPGLTLAGGLAIAIAIGIGAGWYDLTGKILSPRIPLPEGNRIVVIATQDARTNAPEDRVLHDFQEWRRELRTIEDLGAYRTDTRNLMIGRAAPEPIQVAELTVAALATTRVPPLLGRGLVNSDELPGAPGVVVLSHETWQRSLQGRADILGLEVRLGNTLATVVGVMPEGFGYPVNHDAWMPLALRAAYEPLDGAPISVIGRLAPGISLEQANAEVRAFGQRTAAAFPGTHEHLRPAVTRLGEASDFLDGTALATRNIPVLLVLMIACMSVGTLVYARTATREGEIAIRAALGAGRARIVGQLFVEALVLSSVSAAVGLLAVDRTLRWGIESVNRASGGAPFWMVPGLELSTVLYAGGLAVVSAVMLSVLPALRVTRARVQPHLANLGTGRATLRFGRVWTAAMIAQVALTAMGIPAAMESANQTTRKVQHSRTVSKSGVPVGSHRFGSTWRRRRPRDLQERRTETFAALERRLEEEPGVVAVVFADRVPGEGGTRRAVRVESSPGATPVYDDTILTSAVTPEFFAAFDRPMIAGRPFHAGDSSPTARTIVVNEAFARAFARDAGPGSPIGARLQYPEVSTEADAPTTDRWFEIVGIVGDFGLDPDDKGDEQPCVFHAATPGAMSPLLMSVRMRGSPAALAARLPVLATTVDSRILVPDAQPMADWIRDTFLLLFLMIEIAVTGLVLFLSALGIFSLASVSVSRRTREIGLRVSLGAMPRQVLTGILSQAVGLMASGIIGGSALLLTALALGLGPSGEAFEDIALFGGYLGLTSVVMVAACLLACIGPATRALRLNPSEALRDG